MFNYALRRILIMIPLLLLISVVSFTLAHMMPGDALTGMLDPNNTSPAYIKEMREKLGLNDSLTVQYGRWLGNMFKGDLGQSFIHKLPVMDLLKDRIGNTLLLALLSIAITFILAIILGSYTGRYPGSISDRLITSFNYIAYATPTFVSSIIAIYIFAIQLGWVPINGTVSVDAESSGIFYWLDRISHTLLPAFVLGLFNTAAYTQFLRNDIIDNSKKDYVRTAMAKGIKTSKIYNRHILRNSLIPLVTFLGLEIGTLLSGAIVVETIFTYPGVGSLFFNSISRRDYSVVMSIVTLLSFMTLFGNLITDILYGIVDPRIRVKS